MRLTDCEKISWGKEDKDVDPKTRRDIIYRVFLGDRQIWERTDEEEEEDTSIISNKVTTIWHIVQDFHLARVTGETNIMGSIDWGDRSETDSWRSGNSYFHHYVTEGRYNITFNCTKARTGATIGQIKDLTPANEAGNLNTLVGISFGRIPYANSRLGTGGNTGVSSETMFQDILTLDTVIIPIGLTKVPNRICYNTGVKSITFPKYTGDYENVKLTIGNYAFVRSSLLDNEDIDEDHPVVIKVSSSVGAIGDGAIGFMTNGSFIPHLKYYCVQGTEGEAYAQRNYIPIAGYLTE